MDFLGNTEAGKFPPVWMMLLYGAGTEADSGAGNSSSGLYIGCFHVWCILFLPLIYILSHNFQLSVGIKGSGVGALPSSQLTQSQGGVLGPVILEFQCIQYKYTPTMTEQLRPLRRTAGDIVSSSEICKRSTGDWKLRGVFSQQWVSESHIHKQFGLSYLSLFGNGVSHSQNDLLHHDMEV
jgi:hypothetical protein